MHRSAHDGPRDHPDDLLLLAWVDGAVESGAATGVDDHLDRCLVCSVRAARLETLERMHVTPCPDAVDALVQASPVLVLPDQLPRPLRRRRPRDAPVEDASDDELPGMAELDRRRLEALWHACLLEADEAHRAMDELFAEGGW